MKNSEQCRSAITEHERNRLEHALSDFRNYPVAYPILAAHELLERTPNGFKSEDPETIARRIRELLAS